MKVDSLDLDWWRSNKYVNTSQYLTFVHTYVYFKTRDACNTTLRLNDIYYM